MLFIIIITIISYMYLYVLPIPPLKVLEYSVSQGSDTVTRINDV